MESDRTMQGFPPPPEARVTLANWDSAPFNRWSFRNIRSVFPTAEVWRGDGTPSPLPRAEGDIGTVSFADPEGRPRTLDEVLDATYTDGFIALHRGRIVAERYFNGMTERSLHLSQSVAKSIVATSAGVLWGEGGLDLEAPVRAYVPETEGTGYAEARISHLLDMTSGVAFVEDYQDPKSEICRFDRAAGWKPRREDDAASAYEFLLTLRQTRDHGGAYEYRSSETDMLGWVLERASGQPLAELVSRTIWAKLGAERDACFIVDRAGAATANGGFNATLRDYARFGQMQLDLGVFNGQRIVPRAWAQAARTGDRDSFEGSPYAGVFPNGAYSRNWWVLDRLRGLHAARGIFGQLIYVDPAAHFVAVKLSTRPTPLNFDFLIDTLRALAALAAALEQGT